MFSTLSKTPPFKTKKPIRVSNPYRPECFSTFFKLSEHKLLNERKFVIVVYQWELYRQKYWKL